MQPTSADKVIRLTTTAVHKEEAPWILLRDAALQRLELDYSDRSDPTHKSIDAALVSALRQGVEEYNDPEACRDLSDHSSIIEFSPEWVRLKEKSAMHGHTESCYNLGRYYLEYWGWYPCIGGPLTKRPEAMIAFDWLELSAEGCLDDAKLMCDRYLLLALALRENGLRKEGHEAVKRGIQSIEKFSTDSRSRRWAIRQLEPYDRSWDYVTARVEVLLGEFAKPKLSKAQRYQPRGLGRLLGG